MIHRKQERVTDMLDLLGSVIGAHGGLDRWRTVRAIDVTFNFSGGLLDLKGHPGHRRPPMYAKRPGIACT